MICVCVDKTDNIHLLQSFVPHLSQPERLGVTWIFAVVMMRSVLEHCPFKDLPDCHHEHPSLVSKVVHV